MSSASSMLQWVLRVTVSSVEGGDSRQDNLLHSSLTARVSVAERNCPSTGAAARHDSVSRRTREVCKVESWQLYCSKMMNKEGNW